MAMSSQNESWASSSWIMPNDGESRGGNGMHETIPGGGRFFEGSLFGDDFCWK
jgi:hypothetical protein